MACSQGRDNVLGQGLEGSEVTQPRGLVRGEGVHDAIVLGAVRDRAQGVHVLLDPGQVDLAHERKQAALHEVLLAGWQLDGAAPAYQVGHDGERGARDGHGPPCQEARSAVEAWTVDTMAPPISLRGST